MYADWLKKNFQPSEQPRRRCLTHDLTETVERCPFFFHSNDVRFRLFESNDVRFRFCFSLTDIVRLCLTIPDNVRFCSTFFDFTGHGSTFFGFDKKNSDIVLPFLSNHVSKISAWAAAKYNTKGHKLEHQSFV